jgi:hypothetical protein
MPRRPGYVVDHIIPLACGGEGRLGAERAASVVRVRLVKLEILEFRYA